MGKQKRAQQLGMNPSTAQQRLVKDLLWHHVAQHVQCHHCGESMTRDTFSIEHIEAWLDSDDPIGKFFDMENISFSHLSCNSAAGRRPHATGLSQKELKALQWARHIKRKPYCSERRRERYRRTGS